MIADGLGGHEDGQIASELAIRTVAAHLLKTIYVPMLASQVQGSQSAPINESLFDGMEAANEAIKRGTDGGGSTLTVVLVLGRTAYIAHIGDSRAYLIEGSSVSQITQDHSLVARLMEIKHLTAEQAAEYGQRNVLYKALGQGLAPEPDFYYHPLNHGSHLLLCSDGLWSVLSQQDVLAAIDENKNPQAICAHLLSLAIDRGSDDNVSVILLSSKE